MMDLEVGVEISEDIAALLECGDVGIWIATANRECMPQTTRSMGARVQRTPAKVWLYVPLEQSHRVLSNARPGAKLSATFVRIYDYRAVQIKGDIVQTRPCTDDERQWPQKYLDRFADANVRVGMNRELIEKMVYWPAAVVEVDVRELYSQTPGQNAGAKL